MRYPRMTSSCDTATAGMTHGGGESKFRVSSACKRALSRNADRSLVPVKCAELDDAETFDRLARCGRR